VKYCDASGTGSFGRVSIWDLDDASGVQMHVQSHEVSRSAVLVSSRLVSVRPPVSPIPKARYHPSANARIPRSRCGASPTGLEQPHDPTFGVAPAPRKVYTSRICPN
jgi:hypothetical protein